MMHDVTCMAGVFSYPPIYMCYRIMSKFQFFKKRNSEIPLEYNAKSLNNCFVLKVFFFTKA